MAGGDSRGVCMLGAPRVGMDTPTWAELFERAGSYETSVEQVQAVLDERREGQS